MGHKITILVQKLLPEIKKEKIKSHFGVKNSNLRRFREQRFGFGAENVPLGHRKCGHKGTNLGLKIAISGQKLTFKEKQKPNFGVKSGRFGVEINFGGGKRDF